MSDVSYAKQARITAHIEIVASSNYRFNAMTTNSQMAIKTVLSSRYTQVGITIVDDVAGLERLVAKRPDLVVLGTRLVLLDPSMGYDNSPQLWLADYLSEHTIAYTGSNATALSIASDKHTAKQKVIDAGLKSSKYCIAKIHTFGSQHGLRFPLFVKPADRSGSKGIDDRSVVYSGQELQAKLTSMYADIASDALIEEYLPGREFSVAVVRRPYSNQLVALPIEIIAPANAQGNSFLSKAVKKADTEKVIAVDDTVLRDKLGALATSVFKALGARDFGRIDMRLDASGTPNFIEANLTPGLSNHGYLAKCFSLNKNLSYEDMVAAIVGLGFERVHAASTDTVREMTATA
jgi:D-alanine-D-alanine ligase